MSATILGLIVGILVWKQGRGGDTWMKKYLIIAVDGLSTEIFAEETFTNLTDVGTT